MKARPPQAFTLLELLVVIGLIGAMSFFLAGGLGGGSQGAALQSGQAALANLVTATRAKAAATGRKTRLLFCTDVNAPEQYLRFVVLQLAGQPGASPAQWDTVATVTLPEGIYVVPASLHHAAGLVDRPSDWKRVSDPAADLVSDLFQNQTILVALEGDLEARPWTGVAFTTTGNLAALGPGSVPPKGFLVITPGSRKPPGSYSAGDAPVRLGPPETVRGLVLSAYGVPALLNERRAF